MNRIGGIYNLDHTPVTAGEIDRMACALMFQGSGQSKKLLNGEIGLVCTSSQNPGSAREYNKPFQYLNQANMVVLDGRIDNRRELFKGLNAETYTDYGSITDEDIVFAAYRKWGLNFLEHLIGDFAFAIWDKYEHRLVCARDQVGIRPFYYFLSSDVFIFASTPFAMFSSARIMPDIQEERIADHLTVSLEGVDKVSSFYKGIYKLPPAHMLILDSTGLTVKSYWKVNPVPSKIVKNDEIYIEVFRELFRNAVGCRLHNAVASASMLSGGVDSSSIAGMGRKIFIEEGKGPLQVIAAISTCSGKNRENSHISSVLSQENLNPYLVSEREVLLHLDELVMSIEAETEPFDCLMNLNRLVYLQARDLNFCTVLDGIDGDLLLSGTGHLVQLWRKGKIRTILDETFQADGITGEYKLGKTLFMNSFLYAFLPLAPDWFRRLRHPYRYKRIVASAVKDSIIDPDFIERSNLLERFATLDSHNPRPVSSDQMEFHKLALDQPYLTVAFERYERVASAFGIEASHPFSDVRLVEFCLGLPWQLKTHHGWTKVILRKAMEPYLPPEVVWRRDKDSLMWEYNRLILKTKAQYFHQATLDERESLRPYVDIRKLERFWQEYLTRGDETHADQLWSGLALAFWLRRHRNMVASLRTDP